jgi:hypothetical protein
VLISVLLLNIFKTLLGLAIMLHESLKKKLVTIL